jgi:hypothetical protein
MWSHFMMSTNPGKARVQSQGTSVCCEHLSCAEVWAYGREKVDRNCLEQVASLGNLQHKPPTLPCLGGVA